MNIAEVQAELKKCNEELKRAEGEKARAEGQLSSVNARLHEEFQVGSVEEGQAVVAAYDEEIASLNIQISETEKKLTIELASRT